jgi:hypothetical protein
VLVNSTSHWPLEHALSLGVKPQQIALVVRQLMSSAHEFYDYADEHFGWAETAKTERERSIFLQTAAAWLEVQTM